MTTETKSRNHYVGELLATVSQSTQVKGFRGDITLPGVTGEVALAPNNDTPDNKRTEKTPKYKVLMMAPNGQWADIGRAWEKPMKTKGVWLSISLEGPFLGENKHNVSAFLRDGSKDTWDVQWSRAMPSDKKAATPSNGDAF